MNNVINVDETIMLLEQKRAELERKGDELIGAIDKEALSERDRKKLNNVIKIRQYANKAMVALIKKQLLKKNITIQ